MGQTQFRRGEIAEKATRKMTDVISITKINAKSSKTGTVTVAGKGLKFRSLSSSREVALA